MSEGGRMMDTLIQFIHAMAVAILVGKVVLLSFVVAPILAKNLDREPVGKVVRQLFQA
jgi:putative copper export protein